MRRQRRLRKREIKKRRTMIIISMFAITLMLTSGYAVFQTVISINVEGNTKEYNAAWQLKKMVVSSGDGLYRDIYDNGKYIYRGENPNNYIFFNNNELWRILSIENDETIKIVKDSYIDDLGNYPGKNNSVISNGQFDVNNYRDLESNGQGGTYCEQSSYGCNAWLLSNNFVNGNNSGTVLLNNSLNLYLNNDYYNLLSEDKDKIVQHDWYVGGVIWINNDMQSQINDEKTNVWNGKIGLLTASEYLLANSDYTLCGTFSLVRNNAVNCTTTNYLYVDSYQWWLITPPKNNTYDVLNAKIEFNLGSDRAIAMNTKVRPAVYLNSDIKLEGKGTKLDPYEIK